MPSLYVSEFKSLQNYPVVNGGVVLPMPPETTQLLSAWPQASAAFGPNTRLLRVHADSICSIAVGTGISGASAAAHRMAAGQTEYLAVNPGDKIAVITNT